MTQSKASNTQNTLKIVLIKVASYASSIARFFSELCSKLSPFWKLCYFYLEQAFQKETQSNPNVVFIANNITIFSILYRKLHIYSAKTELTTVILWPVKIDWTMDQSLRPSNSWLCLCSLQKLKYADRLAVLLLIKSAKIMLAFTNNSKK